MHTYNTLQTQLIHLAMRNRTSSSKTKRFIANDYGSDPQLTGEHPWKQLSSTEKPTTRCTTPVAHNSLPDCHTYHRPEHPVKASYQEPIVPDGTYHSRAGKQDTYHRHLAPRYLLEPSFFHISFITVLTLSHSMGCEHLEKPCVMWDGMMHWP